MFVLVGNRYVVVSLVNLVDVEQQPPGLQPPRHALAIKHLRSAFDNFLLDLVRYSPSFSCGHGLKPLLFLFGQVTFAKRVAWQCFACHFI